MSIARHTAARTLSLRLDLTPPNGARAKEIAASQGPLDETGLEQIASFAEREPSWTYGKVTAERLRLLADKLRAEAEAPDTNTTLDKLEADLVDRTKGEKVVILVHEAQDYLAAIRTLRTARTVAVRGWERSREDTLKLEAVVARLRDRLAEAQVDSLDVSFTRGDAVGDDLTIDQHAELEYELGALQDASNA